MVLGKVRAVRSTTLWLVVLLLAATVLLVWRGQLPAPSSSLSANAAPANPTRMTFTITGAKQGPFKGEGTRVNEKGLLIGLSYAAELSSPRDLATGQASGKRQYKPITVTKEWGAATPQILQAAADNELLPAVQFSFSKRNSQGTMYVFQTVKLTDAEISDVKQYTDKSGLFEIDEISFVFRKIEVQNKDGNTTFADDWAVPTD